MRPAPLSRNGSAHLPADRLRPRLEFLWREGSGTLTPVVWDPLTRRRLSLRPLPLRLANLTHARMYVHRHFGASFRLVPLA